ncbi:MAG: DinB family protein [Cyclobacteriaceae bacterium]|nr:DinB family protein [Cyclobacteriaceae bacterium]
MKTSPDFNTLPSYYRDYVAYVERQELLPALKSSGETIQGIVHTIPEEKGEHRYAPGKWTIKEVLCHLMDAERIFAYRALRFARNDNTPLAGYEENDYAPQANAHARTVKQLAQELKNLRATTLDLFTGFTPVMLQRMGTANNNVVSVINIGYIIAGHEIHHCTILKQRYLNPL